MRRSLLLLPALALFLAPANPAQTKYYHCPDNNPASGSKNVIPFGTGSSSTWKNQRYQSLVRKSFLPGKPGLLKSIAFPPSSSGNYRYGAMMLRIGHNTSGALGPRWANSYSQPPVTLVNQVEFSWQVTADSWNPMPFSSPKPFLYNGKDNLVVEVVALGSDRSQGKSGFYTGNEIRAYYYRLPVNAYARTYGKGCRGSNNREPLFAEWSFPLIGADFFRMGLSGAIAKTGAFFFFGTSKSKFGGLALPFDLGAIGATGCFLNSRITILFPAVTTSGTGTAGIIASIPADPVLEGATFYGQWLIADPKANPAGLVATKGMESRLGRLDTPPKSTTSKAAVKVRLGFL